MDSPISDLDSPAFPAFGEAAGFVQDTYGVRRPRSLAHREEVRGAGEALQDEHVDVPFRYGYGRRSPRPHRGDAPTLATMSWIGPWIKAVVFDCRRFGLGGASR
jgi:hypothetical protein